MKALQIPVFRGLMIAVVMGMCGACAEAKIGMGPFKAGSIEVGPGGVEAKGPSAGPVSAGKVEAGEKDDD